MIQPIKVSVKQEGSRVLLEIGGRAVAMPWDKALELSRALRVMGKKAEAHDSAQRIIHDGAILLRAGVPVGLTDDVKLQEEIAKEAAWNKELRRYMPGGIRSRAVVHAPKILRGKPREAR